MQTRIKSKAFEKFTEAAGMIANPEVEKWKQQGGGVIGYFCSAMPEELITAAGFYPFRLRATGSTGTELSDSFFTSMNCTFPRHAFNMALNGEYDFIDGLVLFNSCDHIRRIYDHWIRQLNTPLVKILSLPKKAEPAQVDWFRKALASLKDDMEKEFKISISDDNLREAIKCHNRTRKLLRAFYDLRKKENPPITGWEMLTITVAETAFPQDTYNSMLEELFDEVVEAPGISDYKARLMVLGGELDNPEYIKVIEDQGCLVVTDSLCFGSRMLWKDVNEDIDDPLQALAQYYVADRPSCARMFTEYENRSQFIKDMLDEFRVDGAVFERLTFCDIWGFEQFSISNDFKSWGVPLLCMDREYILSAVGQLKTRVQAFLETIGR